MRVFPRFFALVALAVSASSATAQNFTWNVNGPGTWDTPLNWVPSTSPGSADTARFDDVLGASIFDPPPVAAAAVSITSGQAVRNISFLAGNNTTVFTIGAAGQTLNMGVGGSSTISRNGAVNSIIAANVSTASGLQIQNNSSGLLSLATVNTNGNTVSFSGSGTINVASVSGGTVNANSGTTNFASINGSVVNVSGGTNTLSNVSGTSTINLTGGSNSITSMTGGTVNVSSGTNTIGNVVGTQVNVTSNLNSGITVGNGGNLRGTGTINGNVVFDSGAQHSPGFSPGTQTINGNLTYNGGSTFNWELDGNTTNTANFDRVILTGANRVLTINPTVTTNLSFTNVNFGDVFWTTNQTWTVFSGFSSLVGGIGNFNIVGGGAAPGTFTWQQTGSTVNLLFNVSAVPEPSSMALLALAGCAVGLTRFRRRRA